MAKKILVFSLAYFPKHVGGAEVAIKEITERTSPEDYEFHMICLRFDSGLPRKEKVGKVLVHRIGFSTPSPTMADLKKFPLHLNKFLFQFLAPFYGLWLHKKYKYDAIWAMMAHSCGVPAAIFKILSPKIPYLLTLQEGDPIPEILAKARPVMPLFRRAFTTANMIQAISNYLANWAREMGFKGPLEVIPNAVNTAHFSQNYSETELGELKKKLGKKTGEVYLITTSRLVKKNASDDVIRALALLPKKYHFLILGTGPDEDMLRALAKSKSLESRVHFLGQVEHSNMPKYLKVSDIFIRPSLSEGMGNSFIEAMAARLPVIATQEGGIADFLFDPEKNPDKVPTGRAIPPRDPEAIARAVKLFEKNAEETRKIVDNAEKMVKEKYDWNLIARDMQEKVFDKLLESAAKN
ncbi:MAG: glycosyltransferase family 4 protein [Minisyncoccia bacterium]